MVRLAPKDRVDARAELPEGRRCCLCLRELPYYLQSTAEMAMLSPVSFRTRKDRIWP